MNEFVRPEVRAALWRWREVLVGAVVIVLGIWWIIGPGQLLSLVGSGACLAGAGLAYVGAQRARFRTARGGVGSVDIDEGQVTYFGPLTGGAMALREMTELSLLRTGITTHWRLTAAGEHLYIPVDAEGADALFDAFASLPGLSMARLLAVLDDTSAKDTVIWQAGPTRPEIVH